MQQLLARVRLDNLEITRNGRDYLGLRGADGKRFRVHFAFDNPTRCSPSNSSLRVAAKPPKPAKNALLGAGTEILNIDICSNASGQARKPIFRRWIYVLIAFKNEASQGACYVGQTGDICRRMRDHLAVRRAKESRGAGGFFAWVAGAGVDARATVVAALEADLQIANQLEGYWLKLAEEAGFETPGSGTWGRLPRPLKMEGQPTQWPSERILMAAHSIEELAGQQFGPEALYQCLDASVSE